MSDFLNEMNAREIKEKLADLSDKMDCYFSISQASSNEEKAKIWDDYIGLKEQRYQKRLELNKTLFENDTR